MDLANESTQKKEDPNNNINNNDEQQEIEHNKHYHTKRSIYLISISAIFHALGYDCIRIPAQTLITSIKNHHHGSSLMPFANSLVFPFCYFLLQGWTNLIKQKGPRKALLISIAFSVCCILILLIGIQFYDNNNSSSSIELQILCCLLLIFQQSYYNLIITQIMSFVGSVVSNREEHRKIFSKIAACNSIAATCSGFVVNFLSISLGISINNIIIVTVLCLILTAFFVNWAYDEIEKTTIASKRLEVVKGYKDNEKRANSIWWKVFKKNPILYDAMVEAVVLQAITTLCGNIFMDYVKIKITDDNERASFLGMYYGSMGITIAFTLFIVIPNSKIEVGQLLMYSFVPLAVSVLLMIIWPGFNTVTITYFYSKNLRGKLQKTNLSKEFLYLLMLMLDLSEKKLLV